jgi:hypothetical protein
MVTQPGKRISISANTYTIYTKVCGHSFKWVVSAISSTPISDRCIKLSTQPCNIHRQTMETECPYWRAQWLSTWHRHRVPTFPTSQFIKLNMGLADARRMLPAPMHNANCKVWWRRNNGLGLFFMVRVRPLSSSERNILRLQHAYNEILDDSVLPTLWEQFREGPFLFQHDNAT